MKRLLLFLALLAISLQLPAQKWIRINQLGYLPEDVKVAVFISVEESAEGGFQVCDAITDRVVFNGEARRAEASAKWGMNSSFRLDFSELSQEGGYYITFNGAKSPEFRIGADVYEGVADYLLVYMRQQRCGYNPYNDTVCHQHDGYIVDHPTRSGEKIDVTGGWHDATDYLQYLTTSATTAYHMMFAYMEQEEKSLFKDRYDASGEPGANGIPDILDEAKWGLEWLMKMNPEDRVMFNQIADDRDHAGFRVPYRDSVDYGWGTGVGRPVYFVTGKPQGLGKWINRTTGVASTAGKFASTFAMGASLFKEIDPEFASKMMVKAEAAYRFAEEEPGNTQTACLVSPYFYEEDTYVDDIELAATSLYNLLKDEKWLKRADYWGELEPVSPWMELGRGRHYQFYPFINLGHYYLASSSDEKYAEKYQGFMRDGLDYLLKRAEGDPFLNGIPYIWCSNNLTSAAITQAHLYNKVTGDSTYIEMEAALRDWLLGCNPWGTTMIVGFPEGGSDVPLHPHSSYTVLSGDLTYGGLVDGPVYRTVFEERAGKSLTKEDEFAIFNTGIAVYHDDIGDYASNEPTMDGTAGLTYYFAAKESEGMAQSAIDVLKDDHGAIIRMKPGEKKIYLVFTADSMFQGGEKVLSTLKREKIKGSFFLTGNCLRMEEHSALIRSIIRQGHYVGAHSDAHLLYAPWNDRNTMLVTKDSLAEDLRNNVKELEKFGVGADECRWFLPPYEYYNKECVNIIGNMGFKVVNYTPGTATPADYTTPSMANYQPSEKLIERLYSYELAAGLDGAIILIHPGVSEERSDRLYNRLGEIIHYLKGKGYSFGSFNEIK